MIIDIIATIYNEKENIRRMMDSIFTQSCKFNKIIIVDAGSNDGTVEVIQEYCEKYENIELIIKNKCNIAEGRNIAIKASSADIIAVTDAGCLIDRDWLKNITKDIIYNKADVVGGAYFPHILNRKEKVTATFTMKNLNNETLKYPSSRSIAFKKECWSKVGGYPEHLKTAEDTLFDIKLYEANFRVTFKRSAKVYWEPRQNYRQLFKQQYNYEYGDGRAKIIDKGLYTAIISLIILYTSIILSIVTQKPILIIISVFVELLLYLRNIRKYLSFNFKRSYIDYIDLFWVFIFSRNIKIYAHIKGRLNNEPNL